MKLQSKSSRALAESLQIASKCIASKNAITILDNVLLTRRDDGQFFFTASTQDSQITIPAPLSLVSGNFDKSIALPASNIIAYLSTLPVCVVNLDFQENGNILTIEYCIDSDSTTKAGKVSLPYFDGGEFPIMNGVENENIHICLPVPFFLKALSESQKFVATDEIRMVMNGVCIDVVEDLSECVFVATNGRSLIKFTHSNNPATGGSDFFRGGKAGKMIVHSRFMKTLSAFANCEEVDITADGSHICFTSGDMQFVCKAIEGRFPNYNAVIPKDAPSYLVFDKKEMLSVVKRVSLFESTSTQLIRISKNGMFIDVSAEDIEFSKNASDQVLLSNEQCPDQFAIGIKSSSLLNVLSSLDGDTVRMKLSAPDRPCVLTADTPSPTILTLVMPMLLTQ